MAIRASVVGTCLLYALNTHNRQYRQALKSLSCIYPIKPLIRLVLLHFLFRVTLLYNLQIPAILDLAAFFMSESPHPRPTVRFGDYELDLRRQELRKHGIRLKLQEQPYQILQVLTERPSELVTREELQRRLWPSDTFVDFEHGLYNGIKRLREILSDSAESPRYIETVPRRGYRFICGVERVNQGVTREHFENLPDIEAPFAPSSQPSPLLQHSYAPPDISILPRNLQDPLRLPPRRYLAAALVIFVFAIVAFFGINHLVRSSSVPVRVPMMVVLPFKNLTGDLDREFVSDGFTEEMIAQLGQWNRGQMLVIARTSAMSYKGSSKSVKEICGELGASYALEGSIRSAHDGLLITVDFIRPDNQTTIWTHEYTRSIGDLTSLQAEVAQEIANGIELKISSSAALEASRRPPLVPEAYELYLRGRYESAKRTREGLFAAVGDFQNSLAKDPTFAPAQASLAEAYMHMSNYHFLSPADSIPKAEEAAAKALELDKDLAQAHATLGVIRFYNLEREGIEPELLKAISLNQGYADGIHWYALYLASKGRKEDSFAEIRRARSVDPKSAIINSNVAWCYYLAGDYRQAIQAAKDALQVDPKFGIARGYLGQAYLENGDYPYAIESLREYVALDPENLTRKAELAAAYGRAGQQSEWETIHSEFLAKENAQYISPYDWAMLYAGVQDKRQTLLWLQKAFEQRNGRLVNLKLHPQFAFLHNDPEFAQLTAQLP
jgi:TolB-like protein/DNA-binding winged helix-turn-helix (wHTH) protein/Tfp pilus assembly protein PilF